MVNTTTQTWSLKLKSKDFKVIQEETGDSGEARWK